MALRFPEFLVLFDLDGVLVVENNRQAGDKHQFYLLHPNLEELFHKFSANIGVLTHRPRREAKAILSATGVNCSGLRLIYCAEDLLRLAIRHGRLFEILHGGLKKSNAIRDISQRAQISPERICVIDDRTAVICDLQSHGVGLRFHIEQESTLASGEIVRFEPDHLSTLFKKWASRYNSAVTIKVEGPRVAREQLHLIKIDLSDSRATLFERSRPIGRKLRKALKHWQSRDAQ